MPVRRRFAGGWFFATKQPHTITFLLSLVLGLLGLAGTRFHIDTVSPNALWFVVAGWVLLLLGCTVTGL